MNQRLSSYIVSAGVIAVLVGWSPRAGCVELGLYIRAGRPLDYAAIALSQQLGSVITYEDAPFDYHGDLRALCPESPSSWVPVLSQIIYRYPSATDPGAAVEGLLAEHQRRGNPGEFTLTRSGDIFHIVPVRYRNEEGQVIDYSSILDIPISVSLRGTSLHEAIDKVCGAVSEAHPVYKLYSGLNPSRFLLKTQFEKEIVDEPARTIFNEILTLYNGSMLDAEKPFYTWSVRYAMGDSDATFSKAFVFGVRYVPSEGRGRSVLSVSTHRPVLSAVRLIEGIFKAPFTYEDLTSVCPCDILCGTEVGDTRMRGGDLSLCWPPEASVEGALQSLVAKQPAFRWKKVNNRYHLYPVSSRDRQGKLVPWESFMDVTLTSRWAGGDGVAALEWLTAALSQQTGKQVVLSSLRPNQESAFRSLAVSETGVPQSPRDFLEGILDRIPSGMSWELLHDPGLDRYTLTFRML